MKVGIRYIRRKKTGDNAFDIIVPKDEEGSTKVAFNMDLNIKESRTRGQPLTKECRFCHTEEATGMLRDHQRGRLLHLRN